MMNIISYPEINCEEGACRWPLSLSISSPIYGQLGKTQGQVNHTKREELSIRYQFPYICISILKLKSNGKPPTAKGMNWCSPHSGQGSLQKSWFPSSVASTSIGGLDPPECIWDGPRRCELIFPREEFDASRSARLLASARSDKASLFLCGACGLPSFTGDVPV